MSYAETLFEGASSKDLKLAKKLIAETGLDDHDLFPWFASFYFNPHVKSPEMSIKTLVRETLRKKIGFDSEAPDSYLMNLNSDEIDIRDIHDVQIQRINTDKSPESEIILSLIGKPVYKAYDWDHIRVWKLGSLDNLTKLMEGKTYLALQETGAILFSDEINKLKWGKTLMTFHAAGIEGYLMEYKEVYKVVDNELTRIIASFSD